MVVPIATRGRTLGAIAFATAESGGPLDEADLELGEEIAARMAVALENARLYIQLSAAESRRLRREAIGRLFRRFFS